MHLNGIAGYYQSCPIVSNMLTNFYKTFVKMCSIVIVTEKYFVPIKFYSILFVQ